MSAPACLWCGLPLSRAATSRWTVLRCASCGAGTTVPPPSDGDLAGYDSWYRPASGRFAGPGDALLRTTRSLLASRIDRRAPAGPVLDVGCGDGVLLDALHAHGRDALGLERERFRPDVRTGSVSQLGSQWAAVVFFHSLEHLPAPGEALAEAAQALVPGGLLIVAAPNVGSWQARLFGERWLALDLPFHFVHLTERALLGRIRDLRLGIERVSYLRGGQVVFGWLHGLVGLLPGQPDLYDAIRRPEARRRPLSGTRHAGTLAAATILLPLAILCALAEILARRGGTIYVEARRV
jgi:SAM-dependent methyltransferase